MDESRGPEMDEVASEQARRSLAAAHRPGVVVAGGYGRPVHPLLVTIPIGAFVATVAFDVASIVIEGRAFGRPAAWLSAIGIVSGLGASLFGLLDLRRLTEGTAARRTAVRHMVLMGVMLACFALAFLLRRADPDQYLDGTPPAAFALSVLGLIVMFAGAWLGGRLSYRFGVRVVDESDQLPAHLIAAPRRSGGSDTSSG